MTKDEDRAHPEMAPQVAEKAQSAPGNGAAPNSSDEAFASLAEPAQAPGECDASQIERPEMAPQPLEKSQSAPGDSVPPDMSDEPVLSPLVEAQQVPDAPDTPLTNRPQMAPQRPEKAQSALGDDKAPAFLDEAFTMAAAPVAVADPPTPEAPPVGRRIPAPPADVAPLAGGPAEEAFLAAEAAPPPPAIAANVLLPRTQDPNRDRPPSPASSAARGRVTYYQ